MRILSVLDLEMLKIQLKIIFLGFPKLFLIELYFRGLEIRYCGVLVWREK